MSDNSGLYVCETSENLRNIRSSWAYEFGPGSLDGCIPSECRYVGFCDEGMQPAHIFEVEEWVARVGDGKVTWKAKFKALGRVSVDLANIVSRVVLKAGAATAVSQQYDNQLADCFKQGALNRPSVIGITLKQAVEAIAKAQGVPSECVSITFSGIS